ncbi:hypothetical protein ACFQ1E_20070 [Sphingomonas canadensis]|uniref:Uncharacterized protein n=1 Tax=Sphingomonas canadensis TaxID=1219257 RepID=A0ABW3HCU1_9SPHN|nr:hypothetical protein [Sphingomonas canadensis]MCW3838458.1 hypothetical protein [Sphingomonas canadensis]
MPVFINETAKGADGKSVTTRRSYNIAPDGTEFSTAREAAIDAIAFAFALRSVLGDNWERGGYIYMTPTGRFVRSKIMLGTLATTGYAPAGVEAGRPWVPMTRASSSQTPGRVVAGFHIHPTGVKEDANFSMKTARSSGGDVESFVRYNKGRVNPVIFFLGGNDGSFDTLQPIANSPYYIKDDGYRNPVYPLDAGTPTC